MKKIHLLSIMIVAFSCSHRKTNLDKDQRMEVEREVLVSAFQSFLDSANVKGSILIFNLEEDKYYSNNFSWAKKGFLPASTFKIPNSIIALETGVVENDSTLFKWNGEERRLQIWEQDMILKEAFHYSCVPCYQEVARKIGVKRMNEYLVRLDYGKMDVDATNIDMFWLEGKSQITQFQQIEFLKKLYNSELQISQHTASIMKKMMVIEEADHYKISGKTGWSIQNGNNNGWFVGYVETNKQTHFFATNIAPKQDFNMDMFPKIRKELTFKALKQMGIIK